MSNAADYLNVQQLLERGWSRRLIIQFLGAGEASTSPGYRAGRPAHLYSISRVLDVEVNEEAFQEQLDLARFLGNRARDRVEKKRRALLDFVCCMQMPPLSIPFEELVQNPQCASPSECWVALSKLLDSMSSMGQLLNVYASHPGGREARQALNVRILEHIREQYPMLSEAVKVKLNQSTA